MCCLVGPGAQVPLYGRVCGRQRGRMVHALWREADLKTEAGEALANV